MASRGNLSLDKWAALPPNTRISQRKDPFFPSEVNQTVATTTNQEAWPFILSREGLFASSDHSKWAKFHISCLFPGHLQFCWGLKAGVIWEGGGSLSAKGETVVPLSFGTKVRVSGGDRWCLNVSAGSATWMVNPQTWVSPKANLAAPTEPTNLISWAPTQDGTDSLDHSQRHIGPVDGTCNYKKKNSQNNRPA